MSRRGPIVLVVAVLFALLPGLASAQLPAHRDPAPQPLVTDFLPSRPPPAPGVLPVVAGLPTGFADQVILSGLQQAVGVAFSGEGLGYVWLRSGLVRVLEDGALLPEPFLDIREEVADWGDHGLLGFALDPDFTNNGYVYLYYVVDHYYLTHYGLPDYDPLKSELQYDTLGRVTRYTAKSVDGHRTADPASRLVILGKQAGDGPVIIGSTHGVGQLVFGTDGTLLLSAGDGAGDTGSGTAVTEGFMDSKQAIGPFRAQLVDSMNGKILRIDPATGHGVPSNPFYDALAPDAPRSRVWALGLRNPARITLQPGSGSRQPAAGNPGRLFIGDVGAEYAEELDIVGEAGANLGWPLWEGLEPSKTIDASAAYDPDAANPLAGVGGCPAKVLFKDLTVEHDLTPPSWPNPCNPGLPLVTTVPLFVHHRPAMDWIHNGHEDVPGAHARVPGWDANGKAIAIPIGDPGSPVTSVDFDGNCSIGGTFAGGPDWPVEWSGGYYHADFGQGWIRRVQLAPDGTPLAVDVFAKPVGYPVFLAADPTDGALWYIDYTIAGAGDLHRIGYFADNLPPVAVAAATPAWGPSPLEATFSAAGSYDPEGVPLSVRWDFSDGTPWSLFPETHRPLPSQDITAQGTIIGAVFLLDPPGSTGFSNKDPEILRDGVRPPLGSTDEQAQYDTLHVGKPAIDWMGYSFPETHTFTGLLMQEGMTYGGGGWFQQLSVHVRADGKWRPVQGLVSDPPYPGDLTPHFETFELRFTPMAGDAIRVAGKPGGISAIKFITLAELRVLARPAASGAPVTVTGTLTVTDAPGLKDTAAASVVLDDTPPQVSLVFPKTGATYSATGPTPLEPKAFAWDAEDDASELQCSWQVVLHHDDHTHPGAPITDCHPQLLLSPEGGCGSGAVYWQELKYTATDPAGLSATASVFLVPDCDQNLNGVADADDIAAGTSRDLDQDGVPDECQADCDGDGVPNYLVIWLGLDTDLDGDTIPDHCGSLNPVPLPNGPAGPLKPKH